MSGDDSVVASKLVVQIVAENDDQKATELTEQAQGLGQLLLLCILCCPLFNTLFKVKTGRPAKDAIRRE